MFVTKKIDLTLIELYSNNQKLVFDSIIKDDILIIKTRIKLPTALNIVSQGKNLTLKEFWLGNIQASQSMLESICSVTFFANNKTLFTNSIVVPGTMRIEIYNRSFVEYHLLHKNTFDIT